MGPLTLRMLAGLAIEELRSALRSPDGGTRPGRGPSTAQTGLPGLLLHTTTGHFR